LRPVSFWRDRSLFLLQLIILPEFISKGFILSIQDMFTGFGGYVEEEFEVVE
jgi:hypothetical protein